MDQVTNVCNLEKPSTGWSAPAPHQSQEGIPTSSDQMSRTSTLPFHSTSTLRTLPNQSLTFLNGFVTETLRSPALRDGLRLIVVGGAIELGRRIWAGLVGRVYEAFLLEATIQEHDPAYDWLITFLSQPTFQAGARSFEVSTRRNRDPEDLVDRLSPLPPPGFWRGSSGGVMVRQSTGGSASGVLGLRFGWARGESAEGRVEEEFPEWNLLPSFNHTRWIRFEGRLFRIRRSINTAMLGDPKETLVIATFSRSQTPIQRLLAHARRLHLAKDDNRVIVFQYNGVNGGGGWNQAASKVPRKMDSVVLPRGMKEGLEADLREFWSGRVWYAERGIPHRRGYLLYGVPGSGKTSLCTALAGALGLRIYVINLSQPGLDDQRLNQLISNTQPKSMVLLEDIDSAFASDPSEDVKPAKGTKKTGFAARNAVKSKITFSGLLNAIDGVAAQEGNVVFATTNHKDRLDPALARPGRMDVWVEFKNATNEQARDLFMNFYPPKTFVQKDHALEDTAPEKMPLEGREILADRFGEAIPSGKFSMAEIQGYLMLHKQSPAEAVAGAQLWVERRTSPPPDDADAGEDST